MARLSFAVFANSRLSSVNREFTKPRRQRQRERHQTKGLKALVNEDTLLPMMFLGLRKLENICCGHKMFLNKIRNLFCVPDTKFVSTTNAARAGKRGNICVGNIVSATMCPHLPGPQVFIEIPCRPSNNPWQIRFKNLSQFSWKISDGLAIIRDKFAL